MVKSVSVLGSTGSIGTQTLDVIEAFPDRFKAGALVANRSWKLLAEQTIKFRPKVIALGQELFTSIKRCPQRRRCQNFIWR